MKNGRTIVISIILSVFGGMIAGCGSSTGGGSSGDVTITGTVSRPESAASLTASGLMILKGKHKRVDALVSDGIATLIAENGSVLGTDTIKPDGTYTLKADASDLQGKTAFVKVTEEDGESSENPIHATVPIAGDATAVTADVNSTSDFSTALVLAVMDEKTGTTHTIGDDLSDAVAKVDPDAVKNMTESVLGDSDISGESSLDTTDTALEAALEAHQEILASPPGDSETPPVDVLRDALMGDAAAVSEAASAAPTTGGGITTDATLFSACKEFSSTILTAYADKEDTNATEAYTEIRAAADSADDYRAYAGLMADTAPADLTGLDPKAFRFCGREMADMGTDPFASDTKPRQTVIEQIKAGGCDDADTAKFVMGAMGGCLPAASADGTFDFSSFVPTTCALAAMNLGYDLKNKISAADWSKYRPSDIATSFAPKLRDPNAQQTCATTGTSGCGDLTSNFFNNFTPGGTPPVLTGTIPQPPGGDCATSGVSCAPGTTCTTQSSGAKICAGTSGKLGQSCTTGADCDSVTVCSRTGTCILQAGAPTGAPVIGTTGGNATVGGTETGAPPPPPTSGTTGGLCSANSCATGSTCSGGICTPSTVLVGAGASCTSNSQCTGGSCSGGVCQAATGTGAPAANGSACTTNTQCASSNCAGGVCQAVATPTAPAGGSTACTSACAGGTACTSDSICATGFCGDRTSSTASGTCQVPGSTVGGKYCRNTGDCGASLTCSSNLCAAGSGGSCTDNSSCASGSFCGGSPGARQCKVNGSGSTGDICTASTQCSSSNCPSGTCAAALAANGASCTADSGCSSGYCGGTSGNRTCKASGAVGDVCSANAQCSSSLCSGGACLALLPSTASWTTPAVTCGNVSTVSGSNSITISNQTGTSFTVTESGSTGTGTRTGNSCSFTMTGPNTSAGDCTYSPSETQACTVSPFAGGAYTLTYTRVSGDCTMLLGGNSCTATGTGTLTNP